MNLNLPSNLYYLKENYTQETVCDSDKEEANASGVCVPIEVCARGQYRPKSGGGCTNAPISGDWGNVIERAIIASFLLLYTLSSGRAKGMYLIFALVGFVLTIAEVIYIVLGEKAEDADEKEQEDKQKDNDDAAILAAEDEAARLALEAAAVNADDNNNDDPPSAGTSENDIEPFTLPAQDYFGMETATQLWGIRLANYIILLLTIMAALLEPEYIIFTRPNPKVHPA